MTMARIVRARVRACAPYSAKEAWGGGSRGRKGMKDLWKRGHAGGVERGGVEGKGGLANALELAIAAASVEHCWLPAHTVDLKKQPNEVHTGLSLGCASRVLAGWGEEARLKQNSVPLGSVVRHRSRPGTAQEPLRTCHPQNKTQPELGGGRDVRGVVNSHLAAAPHQRTHK